jgi:hypothetical protein
MSLGNSVHIMHGKARGFTVGPILVAPRGDMKYADRV